MVYTDGTCIVADTTAELHAFAKANGITNGYYTEGSHCPRYMVPERCGPKVRKNGAQPTTSTRLLRIGIMSYLADEVEA